MFIPRGSGHDFTSLIIGSGLNYADTLLPDSLLYPEHRAERAAGWDLSSLSNTTFHTAYRTIDEIGTFVKDLLNLYPNQVRLVPIGHSAENREMVALEISSNNTSVKKKSGFVITGTQHAREVSFRPPPGQCFADLAKSGLRLQRPCLLPMHCLRIHQSRIRWLRC